jgi:hypothetical protein
LTNANVGTPPNPDLKWEETRILNLGTDFMVIGNRLNGSFEWFHKNSDNIVAQAPVDPTTGVNTFPVNYASLKTNGFEANLSSYNVKGIFSWTTNLGISYAKSIVTKFFGGKYKASDFDSYSINPSVGKLAYGISSYKWAGLDPSNGDPRGYLNGQVSKNYIGILNDSVQNQVFNGSAIPLYSGFLNNTFNWKNFSFSFNITGRFDYYFRRPSTSSSTLATLLTGYSDYSQRWQRPGDEATTAVPSFVYPIVGSRDQFYTGAEINVLRADNIRLADARIQYSFGNEVSKKAPFRTIQIFAYANNINLILWRAEKSNFDPDFTAGTQFHTAPIPRSLTFGANLNFK